MKKDSIIRVYDRIRIDNPEIFVRCGYPKCMESEVKEVGENYTKDIQELISKVGGADLFTYEDWNHAYRKIVNAIAYARLKANNFGGTERKIYTKFMEELKGKEFPVSHIRFVCTGTYHRGTHYYALDDCPDYEPAYLENQKRRKILKINTDLEIEDRHVTKIFPETTL